MRLQNILGLSAGYHDAAVTVINNCGDILFAGHSERYSKKKNDANICPELMQEVCDYEIDTMAYYERPWKKQLRQLYSGQGIEWNRLTVNQVLKEQLGSWLAYPPNNIVSYSHHLSHAAAGFQTSPYNDATVVVIDAIGEFDTISIYNAWYDKNGIAKYKKLWGQKYPHSIGLFYSAMTQHVGLRPLDEEYILMGMAAYGNPKHTDVMSGLITDIEDIRFAENLHIGTPDKFLVDKNEMDVASSAQNVVETLIKSVISKARMLGGSKNLVYGGGVALNCLANRLLGEYYDNIWIMPNPGDAGSSLGAACLGYGKRVNWTNAFLGHDISGVYPANRIIDCLVTDKIVGVANGRAEFGPRALGNRSLLADPRGNEIKDKVNEIKRRQKFRPFAPIILEEHVDNYFDMPRGFSDSRYMQVIARCRHPQLFPAIVHHDGTSRVQTVPSDGSGIRELLEKWYILTGCPMLLNTSLNVRGEPMINDRKDADRFELMYNVKVIS